MLDERELFVRELIAQFDKIVASVIDWLHTVDDDDEVEIQLHWLLVLDEIDEVVDDDDDDEWQIQKVDVVANDNEMIDENERKLDWIDDDDDIHQRDELRQMCAIDDCDEVDFKVIYLELWHIIELDEVDEVVVSRLDERDDDEIDDVIEKLDVMQQHIEVDDDDDEEHRVVLVVSNDEIDVNELSLWDTQ